jgi:hypothetical protein
MDNIIRVYILQSDAKLHPLLAFVSVLGGLRTMGLWGVFVGPIVAACLYALVKIFNTELRELSRTKFGGSIDVDAVAVSLSQEKSLDVSPESGATDSGLPSPAQGSDGIDEKTGGRGNASPSTGGASTQRAPKKK